MLKVLRPVEVRLRHYEPTRVFFCFWL